MKLNDAVKKIKQILEVIEDTDIETVTYEKEGSGVSFTRYMGTGPSEEASDGGRRKPPGEDKKDSNTVEVCSHSVGIFRDYLSPSRKALAREGQTVSKGEKIGLIESMKIMKEIVSPVKGKIIKKHVKHGAPVEYGQKLFEIENV